MAVTYHPIDIEMPEINEKVLSLWIYSVARQYDKSIGNIAYIFCNDEKILEINRQYLHHDYFTDIITFDYTEGKKISGDLYISLDTIKTNSVKYKTSFADELYRVIIHGILHLCGIDDKGPGQREIMEEAENKALEKLKGSLL